jgi:hypothetical protein
MRRARGPSARGNFEDAKEYALSVEEKERLARRLKTEKLRAMRLLQEENKGSAQRQPNN